MNKKRVISLLLVLFFVVTGTFAVSVTMPNAATATLKANIGEYLEHGFTVNNVKYQPSITIDDAFNATTHPSFTYGYRTNAVGDFTFTMKVGDFISTSNASHIVKIKSITSDGVFPLEYVSDEVGYKVFADYSEGSVTDTERNAERTFVITPAIENVNPGNDYTGDAIDPSETVKGGAVGSYESTITFAIASV